MLPQIIGSWSTHAQGSLTPPGAPAPTMKTLQQVEPRTPISSAPFTITEPGSYCLTTNLTVTTATNAITIATNGVTLDLNGYTIRSTANPAGGTAILIGDGLRNLAILNGNIEGGVTNNAGTYSGPGFGHGIYYSGTNAPRNVRVIGINVSGCLFSGIFVGDGDSTVVESCAVQTVGNVGIVASVVKNCTALDCGTRAISGSTVSDCRAESAYLSTSSAVSAYTVQNCHVINIGRGTAISANTVLNCYGYSNGEGTAIGAYTAQNCYGYHHGYFGAGVYANIALNSYGFSVNVIGLKATIALNCYGEGGGGPGVEADIAQNCYGVSSGYGVYAYSTAQNCYGYGKLGRGVHANTAVYCSGQGGSYGVYATQTAIGCYGQTTNGPAGLYAQNAAFCVGERPDGTAIQATLANGCWAADGTNNITYKYNMP
jgi:hypothetical protein